MAITNLVERLEGFQSEISADNRRCTRVFAVTSDTPTEPITAIEAAPGVAEGSFLPGDGTRKAKSIRASYISESMWTWLVTVEYEQAPELKNPLEERHVTTIDFADSSEPVYVDKDGNAVTNSAGVTMDPPIEQDISDPVVIITRNEHESPIRKAIRYRNAVNSDVFNNGIPAGQAKIKITADEIVDEVWGIYWRVTYRLMFREDGWNKRAVDEGRYTKGEVTARNPSGLEEILGKDEQPVNDPVRLDGHGQVLAPGLNAVFIEVEPLNQQQFSILNLPDF